MSEFKAYRCPNCGNMLRLSDHNGRIYKCECCGTEYEKEYDGSMGMVITPYVITPTYTRTEKLGFAQMIPGEFIRHSGEENLTNAIEHTVNNMAYEIAKQIIPYIEITTERDIFSMGLLIRGKLEVVKPDTGLYEYLKQCDDNRNYDDMY